MDIPAIEACELRKKWGAASGAAECALDGFSLTVPRGVCFGLVGPGGSGKTTFASIASAGTQADSGRIRVFGEAPASERVALVSALYEPQRLLKLLTAAAAGDLTLSLSGPRRLARALGFVKAPAALPGLIILDDVAGFDPVSLCEALRLIRLLTARGLTILVCSRFAVPVTRLCHSAAVVRAGKVVASGAAADLPGALGFRLTVADLSDELQEALARDGLTVGYNSGGYWIESGNRAQLDAVIDRIRLAGCSIERLEDFSVFDRGLR
jgi:ABC-2 type transport system ATP-binding protein